nr:biotin-dependent carboxyltransferase family protein [Cellulomonas iranensis]
MQDAGRPGLAAVGVPRSGAADPAALARANRLVGNARDAAVLETVLGGLVVRFGAATAFALVGAVDDADLDGAPVPVGVAVRAPGGATLTLHAPARGLRSWLAVRGGVDVPGVLGSRSRDVLSGLGPAPLRAGDVLAYGTAYDGLPELPAPPDLPVPPGPRGGAAHARDAVHPAPPAVVHLPAVEGPRLTHLDAAGRVRLWSTVWEVSPDSNRVAVRLTGPALTRAAAGELPSEGLVAGAVQVPHDGRPVLFGPDHPVTGGYPVVAVLTPDGRARAAQLRPGDRVRLVRAPGGASA